MPVARYIRLDPKSLPLSQRLTHWTLHPQSRRYRAWKAMVLLSIYVTVMMEPFASAFNRRDKFISALYFADFIYLADVLLRFHVPYIEDHVYVMDVRKIAWNYLESQFWMDMAGLVPIELIAPMFQNDIAFWILRSNRLIRVFRIFHFFSKQEERLDASILLFAVKFTFLISLVCHWFTCVLFILGCPTECQAGDAIEHSWPSTALPYFDIRGAPMFSKYIMTLYFAAYSLTSVGFGHLRPVNNSERWAMIFGLGVCNFTFGYCTGIITSLLVNYRGIQLQYEQKVQAVRDFMMQRSFPEDLQSRIIDYYMYLWMRTGGIDAFSLLQQLPPAFNAEVVLQINQNFLKKVTIFNGASKRFLMTLSRALRPVVFLPGDLIIHAGDVGQEMYFICRGKVEVISDDLRTVYDAMGDGSFFGEISLIKGTPRTNHVLAATHCDIRVLSKYDLAQILDQFPDMADRFFVKAEERYRIYLLRTNPKLFATYQAAQASAAASGVGSPTLQYPNFAARGEHNNGGITNTESPLVESVPNPLAIHIAAPSSGLGDAVKNAAEAVVTNLAHPTQFASNLATMSESVATGIMHSSSAVATNLVQTSAQIASSIATNLAHPQQLATNIVQSSTNFANVLAHNLANPALLASSITNPLAVATARIRNLGGTSSDVYNLPPGVGIQSAFMARKGLPSNLALGMDGVSHKSLLWPHSGPVPGSVPGLNTSPAVSSLPRLSVNDQLPIPAISSQARVGMPGMRAYMLRPTPIAMSQGDRPSLSSRNSMFGSTSSHLTGRRRQQQQKSMLIGGQDGSDPFAPARFM